jgi:hypothetical protein
LAAELVTRSAADPLATDGLGAKSLTTIRRALGRLDLKLRDD